MLKFIPGLPALMAGQALVLADLHIGLEHELFGKGLRIGSQTQKMLDSVLGIVEDYSPELVVFLGDVKHNVPDTPLEETRDISLFFEKVSARAKVVVTPGNHDGNLRRYLKSQNVEISPPSGFVLGDFGFFHGHAWPSPEAMSQKTVVMAHQHPCVEFSDPLGGRHVLKAWCIGTFSSNIREHYPNAKPGSNVIITPAFNPLTGGAILNRDPPEGLHGPLMNNKIFKLEESKVYLLDGTPLGEVSSLIPKGGQSQEGFNGKQKRK